MACHKDLLCLGCLTNTYELFSDHEEADTKLVALVQAADVAPGEAVMVRSPSGDIDILALFLGHDFGDIRVLVVNGTGKSRKVIDITSFTLPNMQKQALIGLPRLFVQRLCLELF